MDVILEVLDTYAFDRLYATVLPLTSSMLAMSTVGDFAGSSNATWSSMAHGFTPYQFEPASKYFSVEPSSYAYMSRLPRDNMARQAISLFFITWYVLGSSRLYAQVS
jgi:lathosterol oxidase